MIKVWILTVIFISYGNGVTSQQYSFDNQQDCLRGKNYMLDNVGSAQSAICLQTEK